MKLMTFIFFFLFCGTLLAKGPEDTVDTKIKFYMERLQSSRALEGDFGSPSKGMEAIHLADSVYYLREAKRLCQYSASSGEYGGCLERAIKKANQTNSEDEFTELCSDLPKGTLKDSCRKEAREAFKELREQDKLPSTIKPSQSFKHGYSTAPHIKRILDHSIKRAMDDAKDSESKSKREQGRR